MRRRLAALALVASLGVAALPVHGQTFRPGYAPGFRPGLPPTATTPISPSPSYQVDFTTGTPSLPAWMAASGGANGAVTNAAGAIVAASAPRFDYTSGALQGLLKEESRTNYFLNSLAPATQTIAVTSGTTYTVSVRGSCSIALSGAGTGTVTKTSPQTFNASSTSLTATVTGTCAAAQVEAGNWPTSPIITTTASVTRSADSIAVTSAALTMLQTPPMSLVVEATAYWENGGYNAFAIGANLGSWTVNASSSTQQNWYNGNALNATSGSGGLMSLGAYRVGLGVTSSGRSFCLNGGTIATDTSYSAISGSVYLGDNGNATGHIDGYIRKLAIYNSALTGSTLANKSTVGAAF